jgi:hypothetical protein
LRIAGKDNRLAIPLGEHLLLGIQSQLGLQIFLVWAVTLETVVRENRANVTVKTDSLVFSGCG